MEDKAVREADPRMLNSLMELSRPYAARAGSPVITTVDPRIFTARYYGACMSCTFCSDACCYHGVDVDGVVAERILADAAEIEQFVGIGRDNWFDEEEPDPEMPGGTTRRTKTVGDACVFLSPRERGRGCLLHAFALSKGRDYHDYKPMVSTLFPLTFIDGELQLSSELEEETLVCRGDGPVAYDACRGELLYYFGAELVAELDDIRRRIAAAA
jgi:Fe-S-cluster containining protein